MANIRVNDRGFMGAQYERVAPEQCEKLHCASLEILERTGVRLHLQEAVDLLAGAGAFVANGMHVRIPSGLVEQALSSVPKRVTLYDRRGTAAMQLAGHRCHYGTGSDCLNIIDHRSGLRRRAVLQDVVDGLTLCDALPHVDFVMSMFLPSDIHPLVSDRYQMEMMLSLTGKPIVFVTNEFSGCVDAVDMAEVVAGSPEALRQKPFLACYVNVTTALRHNQEALEKLLFMAGKGLPVMYIAQATGGITAPVTPAASFALINAAALAGLVLTQLKREGTPYIMPGWGGQSLDMRTMVAPYCPPDPIGMAHAMAHYYGLPMFGIGGCSDSKVVDGQAVAEATLTLMGETLGGASLIHDMGYLESGLCGSLALLVVCNEIIDWLDHFMAPIVINDESLALDLIDGAGLDGQYIDHPHTLANFRQHWYPGVFDRGNYDQWQAKGGKDLAQRAAEHVETILKEHQPVLLPEDVRRKINAIVRRAEVAVEVT